MRQIPTFLDEIPYRSNASSEDMNEKILTIRNGISVSVRNSQRMNALLHLYSLAELYGSTQKFTDMQALLARISTYLASTQAPANTVYWTAREKEQKVSGVNTSTNTYTGVVFLQQTQSFSKLTTFTDDQGERVLHPDTNISVDGADLSKGHLGYRMLNMNMEDVWVDDTSTAATTTVIISHPRSVRSTLNHVKVLPYPEHGAEITNLEYLSDGGTYTQVPGFSSFTAPAEFHFSPVEYADYLRITISNADYFGKRVWGFRNVELYTADYYQDGQILLEAQSQDGTNIANITSFTPNHRYDNMFSVQSSTDAPIYYQIEDPNGTVYYDSRTDVSPFTTDSPPISYSGASSHRIRLRIFFIGVGSSTPVFRSAAMTYTV